MPFIKVKTNVKITQDNQESIKTKLGKSIELIPGKTESRLMISFDHECKMYFKGENSEPMAFVEILLFGSSTKSAYSNLTAAVTEILHQDISIAPQNVYVKYEECEHWGCNGVNF